MRHQNHSGLFLIILGLILAAGGALLLFSLPAGCDYVVSAPAFSANTPVNQTLVLIGDGLPLPWTADLRLQGAEVSSGRAGSCHATVYAVSEGFFDDAHEKLETGRLLNREDISSGAFAALLNRKGAEALFPGMDPIGQFLSLGDASLEIVGITAGGFQLGETQDILLFIPITLADQGIIHPQTLEIRTGAAEAETKSLFAASVRRILPGGSLLDNSRLRLAAFMPLWLLASLSGFYALKLGIRKLWHFAVFLTRRTRDGLEEKYPSQLFFKAAGRGLTVLLLLAAWSGAAFLLLKLIAVPLYTFTDWIPESPADPSSVMTAVKNLLTSGAVSAAYKTRTASAADICAALIRAGTVLFLAGWIPFAVRRRKKHSPS